MERQYVGIDLHRRRSVIIRRDAAGATHSTVRLDNSDIGGIRKTVRAVGPEPDVIVEATYGWVRHEAEPSSRRQPAGYPGRQRQGTSSADCERAGRRVRSSPRSGKPATWRRDPANLQ